MFIKKILILLCVFTQLFLFSSSSPSKINILVLQDFFHLQRTQLFNLGLKEAQKEYKNVVLYMEHMHKNIDTGTISDEEWINYLLKKYNHINIDAIISASPDSSQFLKKNEKLFGEIPLSVINQKTTSFSNPTVSFETNLEKAISETVKLAVKQNPSKKKAILVTNNKGEVFLKLKHYLKEKNINLKVQNINWSEDIINKISKINKETIVFYEPVFQDILDNKIIPKELLVDLAKHSPSPIYTFWSSLLNTGAIGGHVIDTQTLAYQMVKSIIYYKENNIFLKQSSTKTILDWKTMKRFSIKTSGIPDHVSIINKPKSFFEVHYKKISTALIIIILLFIITVYWIYKLTALQKERKALYNRLKEKNLLLRKISITDQLTGLYNRKKLDETIDNELNRANRYNTTFGMIMLDIDYFKQVNDVYGHQVGDEILIEFANVLQKNIRQTDIIGRWGGEEFLIICPESDIDDTTKLAKNLLAKIQKHTFTIIKSKTASFGVSSYLKNDDEKTIISRTDKALYNAKKYGRNRIEII